MASGFSPNLTYFAKNTYDERQGALTGALFRSCVRVSKRLYVSSAPVIQAGHFNEVAMVDSELVHCATLGGHLKSGH